MFLIINALAYGLYWCFERHYPVVYRRLRSPWDDALKKAARAVPR
jgi:hypothetical protein